MYYCLIKCLKVFVYSFNLVPSFFNQLTFNLGGKDSLLSKKFGFDLQVSKSTLLFVYFYSLNL